MVHEDENIVDEVNIQKNDIDQVHNEEQTMVNDVNSEDVHSVSEDDMVGDDNDTLRNNNEEISESENISSSLRPRTLATDHLHKYKGNISIYCQINKQTSKMKIQVRLNKVQRNQDCVSISG